MVTAGAGGDSFDSSVLIGWLYPVSVTSHTAKSRKNSCEPECFMQTPGGGGGRVLAAVLTLIID